MKRKNKIRVGGRVLILIHDGSQWRAGIRMASGRWEMRKDKLSSFAALPDSMLEWAVNQGALSVRLAIPAELHQFEMDTADFLVLKPNEVYQMLSYELAERGGGEVDNIAPAVVSAVELEIDSDPNHLIGGAIARSLIADFHDTLHQYGMRLEGVSSLQGVLLAYHARTRLDYRESILFFGEKESFICCLAQEERHAIYRSIPVGYPKESPSEEYTRRIERRIRSYAGNRMNIIAISGALENCSDSVTPMVEREVRATPLKQVLPELMALMGGARHHLLEGAVALTNLPPKVKDDKYTGGVICFWSILLTTLILGAMLGVKTAQRGALTKLRADISTLEGRQASAKAAFDLVAGEIETLKTLTTLLSLEPPKVDRHYGTLLAAISKTLPQYSRINAVYQTKERTIISGSTLWAGELSGFSIALQTELEGCGLKVVPKTTTPDLKSDAILFTMEIL
ncbi:MAG: hypothetical protein PHO37_00480 [Kiritimatiellae bacterium]|nr:hypothetical protein [Kiritimatiellia bacterium]